MDERLLEKMTGLLSSLHQEIRLVDSQGDSLIPRENVSFYLPGGMRAGEVRESKGYLFMRLDMPEAPSLLCPMSDRAEDMLRLAAGASLGGEGMQMAPEEPPPDDPPPTVHR